MKILFGIILILHGLVHLLYFGHSLRYFELKPGMIWPDEAWAFSAVKPASLHKVAGAACIMIALLFVSAAIMLFFGSTLWRPVVVIASVLSSMLYLFFWNGQFKNLDGQGGVAVVINFMILFFAFLFSGI